MKTLIRTSLAVIVMALAAPTSSFAQGCPAGYTFTALPGGGFQCEPIPSAPEISASASSAGLVLVAGLALMIRGRKRIQPNA